MSASMRERLRHTEAHQKKLGQGMIELHENQKALLEGINETRAQMGALMFLLNKKGLVTDDDIKQEAAERKTNKEHAKQNTEGQPSDPKQEGSDPCPAGSGGQELLHD